MEPELVEYLKKHGCQETLDRFTEEKITIDVLQKMSDSELKELMPTMGDRVNLKTFVESRVKQSTNKNTLNRKRSLLKTLRTKLGILKTKGNGSLSSDEETGDLPDLDVTSSTKMARRGNKNAFKKTRMVEIGWIHKGRQVRVKNGGGTRKLQLSREFVKVDILTEAKSLFFPEGKAAFGDTVLLEENLVLDLADFSRKPFVEQQTIEELYQQTKLNQLRFYLITSEIGEKSDETSSDSELNTSTLQSDDTTEAETEIPIISENVALYDDETNEACINLSDSLCEDLSDSHYLIIGEESLNEKTQQGKYQNPLIGQTANSFQTYDYDNEVFLYASAATHLSSQDLDATLPVHGSVRICRLRRGYVFDNMTEYFMKSNIDVAVDRLEVQMISEQGEDSGGVFRDALSEYWEGFYAKHTIGSTVKIPTTAHNMRREQWEAVANVLILGFKQENYVPIQISETFMETCIYGRQRDDEALLDTFLQSLPTMDSDILKQALKDISTVDSDELIETLSVYEGGSLPNAENIHKLLIDIAHHQVYQKPLYVVECWSPLFQAYLQPLLVRRSLNDIYRDLEVTTRKVLKLCEFPETPNKAESLTIEAFKHYIKSCNADKLSALLRFCTGSDLITGKKIQVRLSPPMCSFQLRPIAHTCGCVLELSTSYDTFLLLREHFDSVLDSKVLRMDIA